jgi:hypothetical protein
MHKKWVEVQTTVRGFETRWGKQSALSVKCRETSAVVCQSLKKLECAVTLNRFHSSILSSFQMHRVTSSLSWQNGCSSWWHPSTWQWTCYMNYEFQSIHKQFQVFTSFGRRDMKSLWNCGSMTCIMCRTCVGSHVSISWSIASSRSAFDHLCNITRTSRQWDAESHIKWGARCKFQIVFNFLHWD